MAKERLQKILAAVGNYAPGSGSYDGDLIGVVWVTFDFLTG